MWRFIILFILFLSPSISFALDLNYATVSQLTTIKGIGQKTAERIVQERQRGGAFESMDDFSIRVKGMGKKRLASYQKQGLSIAGQTHRSRRQPDMPTPPASGRTDLKEIAEPKLIKP